MSPAPEVEIRSLRSAEDYRACLDLQRETWGSSFSEAVPASILKVSQRIGGIAAGAFDGDGALLGFVFGLTGVEGGRLVHWSDMLAVRRSHRGMGLGRRLKEFQRQALAPLGVEIVYWSYDPLEARNAHLNLERLGAAVTEYVVDMYAESDSELHHGLGTDRLVVAWPITGAAAQRDPDPELRIEVPWDIQAVKTHAPAEAVAWRARTRDAFLDAFRRGYRVVGFERDTLRRRGCYLLARDVSATG
jgi:predicted GNAT superfamily acetyltransferase